MLPANTHDYQYPTTPSKYVDPSGYLEHCYDVFPLLLVVSYTTNVENVTQIC